MSPRGFDAVACVFGYLFCAFGLFADAPQPSDRPDRVARLNLFLSGRIVRQADVDAIHQAVSRLSSEMFAEREQAEEFLVGKGRVALHALRLSSNHPDPEVRKRAKSCLDQIDPAMERRAVWDAITELKKLQARESWHHVRELAAQAESPEERLELVESALALEPALPAMELSGLARSNRASDRLIVVSAWSRNPGKVHGLATFLQDSDREVRLHAAKPLIELKQAVALPCLAELAASAVDSAGEEAAEILMSLSGRDTGSLTHGWKGWLGAGMPGLDWNRAASGSQDRGFTVVVLFDGESGGKVTRHGPGGDIVSETTGLLGPNDVEVLPGGRLLIAERNAGKVTERNRRGEIIWQQTMPGSPVSAVTTRHGTIAVATFRELLEVDREGRALHALTHASGFRAVRKSGDGKLAAVTGDGHLLIINHDWKVESTAFIKEIGHGAGYWCGLEHLRSDRWLVALGGAGRVAEIDSAGNIHWQASVPTPVSAHRLSNGNTLVSSFEKKAMIELDPQGREVSRKVLEGRPFLIRKY